MSIDFLEKIRFNIEKKIDMIPNFNIEATNKLNFINIFNKSKQPVIISEIKFASPSSGQIYQGDLDHTDIAEEYVKFGASAISVITESEYFEGNINYIKNIRDIHPNVHILLKDFILSKKQINQGLISGANAILLIAAFLDKNLLKDLYEHAMFLGLTAIIEVHNIEELNQVLHLSPTIIGINNRDLQTLKTNLDTSRKLIKSIPDNCFCICESGIDNAKQIREMIDIGFDGFLIGSSLMKCDNPGIKLQELISEVQNED